MRADRAATTLWKGAKIGAKFLRAAPHGLSRGIISIAQGGPFKSGFTSGFTSSFFSPGTELGGEGFTLRTSMAAIVGGTASALGGGKFANGAMSTAFIMLFNDMVKTYTMGIHTNTKESSLKFWKGHAWISITNNRTGEMHTYSLYANQQLQIHESDGTGGVTIDKELKGGYTFKTNHFEYIDQNQYDSISPYLAEDSNTWYANYTCANYVSDVFFMATGISYGRSTLPTVLSENIRNQ